MAIAGVDISIDGTSQIVAAGTVMSSLTLVVDNNFPTAPNMGPGGFFLDAGGMVLTGAGTPLRIYTSIRSQNQILSPINGTLFTPGPLGVDSPTELWSIYYPSGGYGGPAFNFYYKERQPLPPTPPLPIAIVIVNSVAVNLVQLPDILQLAELLWVGNLTPWHYHFRLCDQVNRFECDPNFSPYGSFIFEDDVFWIGAGF